MKTTWGGEGKQLYFPPGVFKQDKVEQSSGYKEGIKNWRPQGDFPQSKRGHLRDYESIKSGEPPWGPKGKNPLFCEGFKKTPGNVCPMGYSPGFHLGKNGGATLGDKREQETQ